MKHVMRLTQALFLACAGFFVLAAPTVDAQMTCMECHANPAGGGFHGGFRQLGNLTETQLEVVCLSCHDGSYTNPQGVRAPEAAVHQNKNPGQNRDEYGDFRASCLDCHTNHPALLAGDGLTATRTITTDPAADEVHDVEPTTTALRLKENFVDPSTVVITDDAATPFAEGADYTVVPDGNQVVIEITPGGAINAQAPLAVHAGYDFDGNRKLYGARVVQASSTDGIARVRKPIIVDPNGDDGGSGSRRFLDDFQNGWECDGKDDGVRKVQHHIDIENTAFAKTAPPYNGACNPCHTRTAHHRRDDSGGDHTHNTDKNCDQCHNHKDGWVNKGG
jgi:hypothetical protein